jgi:hypothetical protein
MLRNAHDKKHQLKGFCSGSEKKGVRKFIMGRKAALKPVR